MDNENLTKIYDALKKFEENRTLKKEWEQKTTNKAFMATSYI